MRLFIAINLPPVVRESLHRATEPLRVAAPLARWVDQDRLHLTMKFLGENAEEAIPALLDALGAVARRYDPIELELGGLGAFPNLRRPRVVWMGVRAEPELELLHHDVERACETLGHEIDGRAFRPHLTLARIEDRTIDARAIAVAAKAVDFREAIVAESLDLMVSEQAGGRSRYRIMGGATLTRH